MKHNKKDFANSTPLPQNPAMIKQALKEAIENATIKDSDMATLDPQTLLTQLTQNPLKNLFREEIKTIFEAFYDQEMLTTAQPVGTISQMSLIDIAIEGIRRGLDTYDQNPAGILACALLEKYQAVLDPYDGAMELCLMKTQKEGNLWDQSNNSLRLRMFLFLSATLCLCEAYSKILKNHQSTAINSAKLHQRYKLHTSRLNQYESLLLALMHPSYRPTMAQRIEAVVCAHTPPNASAFSSTAMHMYNHNAITLLAVDHNTPLFDPK